MRGEPAVVSAKVCQRSEARGEPFPCRALRVFQTPAVLEATQRGTKGRTMNALFQLKKRFPPVRFFTPRTLVALLLCGTTCLIVTGNLPGFYRLEGQMKVPQTTITFAERAAYQRVIEDVYWRHRTWPKDNPNPKPSLDAVVSQTQLEKKVEDYLRNSQALDDYWQRPITGEQLQAEMDRMAKNTKQPEVLRELFAALGDDPFVIAECLARPALAEHLIKSWYAYNERIHGALKQRAQTDLRAHVAIEQMKETTGKYSEIEFVLSDNSQDKQKRDVEPGMKLDSREWDERMQELAQVLSDRNTVGTSATQIRTGVLSTLQEDEGRYYAIAVVEKTSDRLKLATVTWPKEPFESWIARAESQRPKDIALPTADYTLPTLSDTPNQCIDDTWSSTSLEVPNPRYFHTAVWTGSEVIVWGGRRGVVGLNTGERYNPGTDTWTGTSITSAPSGRYFHTAVWTGSEMIVWGGIYKSSNYVNTGGRYNPSTDTWTSTASRAPIARAFHTAVWTGHEMIVWGGFNGRGFCSGGSYDPATNDWTLFPGTPPTARYLHTAVWTGSQMIVWGGYDGANYLNTGGRYNPTRTGRNPYWMPTNSNNAPSRRGIHTA